MDSFNLMPQMAQPVNRITTGQLPDLLAELSEEELSYQIGNDSSSVLPSKAGYKCVCSYDGDDAE